MSSENLAQIIFSRHAEPGEGRLPYNGGFISAEWKGDRDLPIEVNRQFAAETPELFGLVFDLLGVRLLKVKEGDNDVDLYEIDGTVDIGFDSFGNELHKSPLRLN